MVRAWNTDSKTSLKKWNLAPWTDFTQISLSDIFFDAPCTTRNHKTFTLAQCSSRQAWVFKGDKQKLIYNLLNSWNIATRCLFNRCLTLISFGKRYERFVVEELTVSIKLLLCFLPKGDAVNQNKHCGNFLPNTTNAWAGMPQMLWAVLSALKPTRQ